MKTEKIKKEKNMEIAFWGDFSPKDYTFQEFSGNEN